MKIISILFAGILMLNQAEDVRANQNTTTTEASNYKFNAEIQGEALEFTFWRYAVAPNKYTSFMQVNPINNGEVVICKTSFFVLQNGKQFNSLNLNTNDESKLCYIFLTKIIFELKQTESKNQFDVKKAFTVVYNSGYYTYQFEIPALHGEAPENSEPQAISSSNPLSYSNNSPAMHQANNHWADLEYQGTNDIGAHLWKLTNYGGNN